MNNHYDYDVMVIGAGIHGAGIAQAAAAAGYRVCVLEQATVAAGTSSRSSKLIHGGLRYLEQFQFGLVRECLVERDLLLRIAPELVRLRPFLIPVYRDSLRRPWQIRAGLSLYAVLGGLGTNQRFERLPASHWTSLGGLRNDGLQAVFRYQDAQTDDAQLTRAVMASAVSLEAELLESARFMRAEIHAQGCEVVFEHAGEPVQVHSRVLVNAAGPWARQVAASISPQTPQPETELIQGTHILLDTPQVANIYYLEAPQDRRAVFVMPWKNQTLVGTTETPFTGHDPAEVAPTPNETDYLKNVVMHYFPQVKPALHGAFAGLRVLPSGNARAFGRSREILLIRNKTRRARVLHVYGGKLTSYRADAERALRLLKATLPERQIRENTRRLHLNPV